MATHNSTYPKVAVRWLNMPALPLRQAGQAFCFYQSFCLVDSEVLINRHLRVAVKRCALWQMKTVHHINVYYVTNGNYVFPILF
jgi:hypothetical protein